ncbi:MAG TPA: CoA-binding protein [Planctomycetota bacterium]|nr:CoA-binding protein [Planctomycetota bacterium]
MIPDVMDAMQQRIKDFLAGKTIALVGATDKREKWGYKIWKHLRAKGYEVLPVNPTVAAIDGQKTYPSLRDLPKKPDGVNLVVPPSVSEQACRAAKELGLARVWMQPGAESDEAIEWCDANGLECIHHKCILVETGER